MRDGYTHWLQRQGYHRTFDLRVPTGPEIAVGATLHRYVSVLARYDFLADSDFDRQSGTVYETWGWETNAVFLGARGRLPLVREWLVAFAELDYGLAITATHAGRTYGELKLGYAVRAAGGLNFGGHHFGGYLHGGYSYAPTLEAAGHTRNDGGFLIATGLRLRSLRWWW